ncbi:MAG TPA: M42 family peptidase [Armatimonadetes bacterium]|nr:M42 family peptidase [Armatimonadota bacterium]
MRKESLKFLRRLLDTPSPSGFESEAQKLVRSEMEKFADEVRTDVLGNVIGVVNPEGRPKVMLAGHVDEIGFMVKYIDERGYIYFAPIGGVDAHLVPGERVYIHTSDGPILGVVGKKPIHLMEARDRERVVPLHEQWIDIGARSKGEAEKLVKIGDPITFAVGFQRLRNDFIVARGVDDKMGAFVVTEALRLLSRRRPKAAVFAVSTVQEEIGLRGARVSAFGIEPDVGVAVDVGFATDYPGVDKRRVGEVSVGKGPILHRGANINPKVGELLIRAAEEEGIPYQLVGEPRGTGTDANVIQLTRAGVATGLVSVPNRYMHTPSEVISLSDLDNAVRLLVAFVERLEPDMDFRI